MSTEEKPAPTGTAERTIGHDAAVIAITVAANNVVGPVLAQATEKVLHRPPKPESPIELPPGVKRD
jgi:hypothetical protein